MGGVVFAVMGIIGVLVLFSTIMKIAFSLIIPLLLAMFIGYLAGQVIRGKGYGPIGDILLGLGGGIVGSLVLGMLGVGTGGLFGGIFAGVIGAVLVVYAVRLVHDEGFAK